METMPGFTGGRMKILHTSDWHIGHTLYAKKRYDEHEQFLHWLKATVCAREIDAVVVAGDVFDNGTPGGQAQRLYYDFLTSLLGTCCKTVVAVAGNHDSPTLLEAPAGVLERLNIYTIGLAGEPERHVIPLLNSAGAVGALCVAVPYLRKNELVRLEDDNESSDEKIVRATAQFYRDTVQAALREREKYGNVPIVATGHLFAAGALRSEGDGVRELYVGSLGQVGADVFPPEIDYVALGHIHGAQRVAGRDNVRYCGAPLPMSFGETANKCVLEVDFSEGVTVKEIEVPAFAQLVAVRGGREEILEQLSELAGEEVWVEVTYTGAQACPHLAADVNDAVKGGRAQVLSIRAAGTAGQALRTVEEETLETLSVQDVFLRCLESAGVSEQQQAAMIGGFNEIVQGLEDAESCA
jgi:exonuclease SbcD